MKIVEAHEESNKLEVILNKMILVLLCVVLTTCVTFFAWNQFVKVYWTSSDDDVQHQTNNTNKNCDAHHPTYDTACEPTFTFAVRNRFMYQVLYHQCSVIFQKRKNGDNSCSNVIKICIFGPGCMKIDVKSKSTPNNVSLDNHIATCPEFVELKTLLSEFNVHFTIIDRNKDVFKAISDGFYYLPDLPCKLTSLNGGSLNFSTHVANAETAKQVTLRKIFDNSVPVVEYQDPRLRKLCDNNNTKNGNFRGKHVLDNIIDCDFVDVLLFLQNKDTAKIERLKKEDINCVAQLTRLKNCEFDFVIANNCLFFAFNHTSLRGETKEKNNLRMKCFDGLLSLLNDNGMLFTDSASLTAIDESMLCCSKVEKRFGWYCKHLGWRNYIFSKSQLSMT